jgi:hypothetical protein
VDFLAALESTALSQMLRMSRWSYPLVNIGHLIGIALLFGAIVPLDLRTMGLWKRISLAASSAVLVPVAAAGLAIATVTGLVLFSVRATEYAAMPLFWAKIGLVALGTLNAALVAGRGASAGAALVSIVVWLGALSAGRLLGY